jgi:hypothetical protein
VNEASSEPEAIDPIQVTYTIADTFAVVGQAWRTYVARILIFAAVTSTVFVVLFTILDGVSIRDSIRSFPWDVILALVSLILVLELGVFPLISHFLKKREIGPSGLRFTFSEDGIQVESSDGRTLVFWGSLKRVVVNDRRLLLFLGLTGAFVLPKRAFADESSFRSVAAMAELRWKSARA